jgi:aminopeptidase S
VRVRVDAISARRETRNVIGEIGPAHAERVYMAGGHLDSVVAGPGLNDNGSGVAAVLEVAEQLATRPLADGAALRVGFWGAEEIGLVGSRRYANRLSRAERRRIRAYVNLDMVGSPGEKAAVYAGSGEAGRAIEAALREGLPPDAPEERLGGASDHASFDAVGVPVGGIFTGLDRCYHRACDRLRNVDAALAAVNARATAGALVALAAG